MTYRGQILVCVSFMVLFGIMIVFTSSAVMAGDRFGSIYFFAKKQAIAAGMGLVLIGLIQLVPFKLIERCNLLVLLLSLILLILVLIPGFGVKINGAYRWLRVFGVMNLQPSEVAKVSILLFLAKNMSRNTYDVKNFYLGVVPNVLVSLLLAGLIICQPDLGSAFMIVSVTFVLLYVSGIPKWQVFSSIGLGLGALAVAVIAAPYRMKRLTSFLRPWEEYSQGGFQIIQSWMAFKNGGLWGLGLGESRQKLFFLPEAHSDFIFPVIAEELGFFGVLFVILAFCYLCLLGFRVASLHKNNNYYRYLAFGITVLIAIQALINIAVSTGTMPTKGISLPFISSGGSSLLIFMVLAGILMKLASLKIRDTKKTTHSIFT